ncbi:MAG: hypothetical protein KBD06_02085 [Candidatus Pacebacteria bacterium]|nr:hypothetical protein [Candidatus Paceibacterota bacterium]
MDPADHEHERIEQLRRAMYSRKISGQLHERPRRELEHDREIVSDDWHMPEPQLGKMQVAPPFIGTTRAILKWLLILSVVFFIAAAGYFGYYFLLGGGSHPANPGNIDIAVSGPPQVAGGEPVELQITVVNRNRVPLELADLLITFPPGTRSVADFATDLPSLRQSLGTIEPGGRRQGTISAVFSGAGGQSGNVKVELEYRVQGSSAIFVSQRDYALTFTSSPLSISVDGNTQTTSGQPVQFTVSVASNASAPMRDVVVDMTYPFGFKFSSASPPPSKGSSWLLGDFTPGQRKSILVQGTLSGEQGDKRVFRITAGSRNSTSTAVSTRLAENSYEMNIAQAFLGLTISTNTTQPAEAPSDFDLQPKKNVPIAAPGSTVTVTIEYQNNLSVEINDAVIVARLSGLLVDGEKVRVNDGFYRSSDDTVIWDKGTTQGALKSLTPGTKGAVAFSFVMPSPSGAASDPKIDISVNAAGKRLSESGVPQNLQSTARAQVRLASDLQLASQALYAQNPFGVSGPLPPKAGTETAYALVFTVTNTTSKLQNAKLTAKLPTYVRWIGSHAPRTENLSFNQYNGTFTWDLGTVEAGVGVNGTQPRQIAISIGLTPSASQIGEQPVLVQEVTLTGTDEATGAVVTRKTEPDVTTNLGAVGKTSTSQTVRPDANFLPAQATVVK